MNAPMRSASTKTIYAKQSGLVIPAKIKKLLLGAEIRWEDKNPLSQDMEDRLHFHFDSKTKPSTDLLLRKYGITDVSQYVNIPLFWEINMQLWYETPNNREKAAHIDHHWFKFRGTIFPTTEIFKKERNKFYEITNLEHALVPDNNRNKGYYYNTVFIAQVIGI